MKRHVISIVLVICLFLLIAQIKYVESCCPRGFQGYGPGGPICGGPVTPPKPPDPPKPRRPDQPPEPPTPKPPEPPTPKPPEPPQPSKPPTPKPPEPLQPPTPTTPSQPPAQPEQPPPITQQPNTAPTAPTSTGSAVSRPGLGSGLQPLLQSMESGVLASVVEPWEVWWTRNRDKYLSFREPIEWTKTVDQGGTKSVTIYPIYDELIKVLSDALADKNPYIAFRAAIALGKAEMTNNFSSIDILKKAHETDKRFFVRNNLLLGLGLTGDKSCVAVIKEVLQNKKGNPGLRRSYATLGAGYINDPEINKILNEILSDKNEDGEVKCCACLSLGNLKDNTAIPVLSSILNTPEAAKKEHAELRAYAALGLGRIGTKEVVDELKKFKPTVDKNIDVRCAVVIALGMTGLLEAQEAVKPFLMDRKDARVYGLAAISLAQLKDPKAYELISEALQKNKYKDADGLLVIALGLTGDDRAKTDLRKIFENKKSRFLLKSAAAIGLGLLKDTDAVPLITNVLNDDRQLNDVILTPYLILSLGMIHDPRGVEVLQKIWNKIDSNSITLDYHTNLAVALTMLGKKNDIVLPKVIEQVNQTKDGRLRSYAVHTLGLMGNRESAKIFVDAFKDNDTFVRFETIGAIGFLLDKNMINPINKVTANNVDIPLTIIAHILPIPVW
ncbi:MAG: HEAT repeat domain-containing protein [Planctomycetota bacterium]